MLDGRKGRRAGLDKGKGKAQALVGMKDSGKYP
jgi:hypothetical protein